MTRDWYVRPVKPQISLRIRLDSKSRNVPYHLQYAQQESCVGCCVWRSHDIILTWAPYLVNKKCYTRVPLFSGGMTSDSESRNVPYHLQCSQQVSCVGCCMWRSHLIWTWAPYLVCALGKIRNDLFLVLRIGKQR